MALFALITALIAAAFTLAHRYTRVYHQLSTAEREANRCLAQIGGRLKKCRAETLQPSKTTQDACWALSASPLSGSHDVSVFDSTTGGLEYQKWLAIYLTTDGRVIASESVLPGGPAVFDKAMLDPVPSALSQFLSIPGQQVLARSVRRFAVRAESSGLFQVDVETQTTESGNPATRYFLSSSFPGQ